MTSDTIHMVSAKPRTHLISEMTILKIIALVLLIFVHSDLVTAYPKVMNPMQWFLLSTFFFTGGYLAYSSFHKRGKSLKCFLKSKIRTLYIPFLIAAIAYLILEAAMGARVEPLQVFSHISMLNIFAHLNAIYNWSTLWFIPFLLLFMTITCFLEKYIKSTKKQILSISTLLIATTLLWLYNSPLMLDSLFSQYLLVFVFGFYISKFKIYEKMMNSYKTTLIAAPLALFFAADLSSLFNCNTVFSALQSQLYFNCRSIILTLSLVILALQIIRRIKIPVTGLGKQIADHSAVIYLSEPFISFVILTYIFGQPQSFHVGSLMFYLYQAVRIGILLIIIPSGFMALSYWKNSSYPDLITKTKSMLKNILNRTPDS
ncbi:MAG: acyltransferase [Crenarchaeota archaeon]|nr:acyltransferase [Thermoproteota archaeon]